MIKIPRIVFVHDWLTSWGGAEMVLQSMLEIWPDAPVYTIVSDDAGQCKELIARYQIVNSFIAQLPYAKRAYRSYLAFMPLAVEQFDLSSYDIIISNSHAVAKGVLTGPDQLHISYIQTPIRYAWDLQHEYLRQSGLTSGVKSLMARLLLHYIRLWDLRTINNVDEIIANSRFIARRVAKIYRRDSTLIYPPVDVDRFKMQAAKEDFYLAASRMVPYKRIDLIVQAFSQMENRTLVVIGDGPELKKIQSKAGNNIIFKSYQPFDALKGYLERAKAFIFAAEEDFGIMPIEAQACGTPVIAYGKGGALETIRADQTGLFFHEQTPEAIIAAVDTFEANKFMFHPQELRQHAEKFSKQRFQKEFKSFVEEKWETFLLKIR